MRNSSPTIAETLAGFVTGLDYASIPAAIRAQAKLHLLDSVGIALVSASFEFAHKACAGLAALGSGENTVIGMPAKLAPRDIAAAQFSLYFSAVCAAVRRQFTLQEMDAGALDDPAIRALAAKVEYEIDPQSNFPAHYSGGVEIATVDGRQFGAREDVNLGSAEKPLAASAVEEKFLGNAQRVMPRQRAEEIRGLLLNIESCDDVSAITAQLGNAGRAHPSVCVPL